MASPFSLHTFFSGAKLAGFALLLTSSLAAQITLVDRGLPTANLNDAAGANRSNTAWRASGPAAGYSAIIVGDDFNVGNPFAGGQVKITSLSLWTIRSTETAFANFSYLNPASYSLFLGDNSGFLFPTSGAPLTITTTTYTGGSAYQTTGGTFVDLLRLDFTLDLTVAANSTLYFGLGGYDSTGGFINPYTHASNGPLSGSPQQGSDNLLQLFGAPGSPNDYFEYGGDFDTNGTIWNKSTSLNVVVKGVAFDLPPTTPVPEPSTYGLIGGLALAALALWKRRVSTARG